jgi:protein SCO1/2
MQVLQTLRVVMLVILLALVGCQGGARSPTTQGEKLYPIRGRVVAIEPEKQVVTLDHEDIPGLMKAMQMEFQVAGEKLLEGLRPGDHVQGQLKANSGDYIITQLEKR